MASTHLKPMASSRDDDDEVVETSAGEEEEHNSEESSSEEDEPTKENEKPKRSSERIKKMEEEKKVMIHEGGDWFYNSFMAQSITSLGGDEDFVKRRWSQVTVEKKKMLEDKWRVLLNNEFEALVQKTKFVNELVSTIVKASTH